MSDLSFILKIGLILCSVFGIMAFLSRRSDNRASSESIQVDQSIRDLTPEELAALQPILVANNVVGLTSGVRELMGDFVQQGSRVVTGGETRRSAADSLDVLLPYDAADFVEAHNLAEVVITEGFAVVITMNGFSIVQGYARLLAYTRALAEEEGVVPTKHDAHLLSGATDLLGERDETPEETDWHRSKLAGRSVALWSGAFVVLWMATWQATRAVHPWLILAALLVATAALWFYLRRPALAMPCKVKRVRGMVYQILTSLPHDRARPRVTLLLGNQFAITFPWEWRVDSDKLLGRVVELEVRSPGHQVVGMGKGWSLADELRRFAPVYWGRHLQMTSLAGLALCVVYLNMSSLPAELALARQQLTDQVHGYSNAKAWVEVPPRVGSNVRVFGKARCELAASTNHASRELPGADCKTIRVDGLPMAVPELTMHDALKALANGSFILAHDSKADPVTRRTMDNQLDESRPQVVNLKEALGTVDLACHNGLKNCDALKDQIREVLSADQPKPSWSEWVTRAKEKDVLRKSEVDSIESAASNAVGAQMRADWAPLLETHVIGGQRGGFLVASTTAMKNANGIPLFVPTHYNAKWTSVAEYWPDLRRVAEPSAIDMEGMLLAKGVMADGTPWMQIDPKVGAAGTWASVSNLVWLALALALFSWHTALLVLRLFQVWQRSELIKADLANRPGPKVWRD